jgi:hypothetical protein
LSQDLRKVASDFSSIASAYGTTQPSAARGPPGGDYNDISNTGTETANASDIGWPRHHDGFQQQFARSAYQAGNTTGAETSATSLAPSISA